MRQQTVSPKVGEWYRTREGAMVKCIDDLRRHTDLNAPFPMVLLVRSKGQSEVRAVSTEGRWLYRSEGRMDLIEHLPECTGFDWQH